MAEPLTSQAWVAAWLQKASSDLETARQFHGFVSAIVNAPPAVK